MWSEPSQWYRHEFHHLEKSLSPIRKWSVPPISLFPYNTAGHMVDNRRIGGEVDLDKNTLYEHMKFLNNKKEVGPNWKKYSLGLVLVEYLARTSGSWLPLLFPVCCREISGTTHFRRHDILLRYRRPATDWSPSKAKSSSPSFFL